VTTPREDAVRLIETGALTRERALTAEQREARRKQKIRQELIQGGIKQPASGIFGKVK
jgi:hypothetical protein